MSYSSINPTINQDQFTQEFPRFHCRNVRQRLEAKEQLGLEFLPKCRNPRCSGDCQANCARKESACVARNLLSLPDNFKAFRGNLKFLKAATPADHKRAKKAFGQSLNRWKKRHGYTVAFRAVLHPTNRTNAHYDVLCFTDAPIKPFLEAWKSSWRKASGIKNVSLVPTKRDELEAVSKYQSKCVTPVSLQSNKTNIDSLSTEKDTPKDTHFLLNSRKELGLERVWTRGDFWRGSSLGKVWSTLISEWFPKEDADEPKPSISIKDTSVPKGKRVPTPDELEKIVGNQKQPYIPGENIDIDRVKFARKLPTDPSQAVHSSIYAEQWGLTTQPITQSLPATLDDEYIRSLPKWGDEYMTTVLRSMPNAREVNGRWYLGISPLPL
jgi:hypothetical protein